MPRTPALTRALSLAAAAAAAIALAGCTAGETAEQSDAPAVTASEFVTDGKLTIGTGEPAYFPWVLDDAPESGEGFESAVAYAVAEELGFAADDVVWVRTTFDQAIAPGPKDFDVNLQQFSITDERKEAVDFSSPYYETTQTVITIEGSRAAGATSIADLKNLSIGAQTGTTSLAAIESQIAPAGGAQVFNTNDDAKLALQSGTVDAIVVDLPTAFYLTGAELTGGLIIGQLPQTAGTGDEFGLVLAKDSPLTERVTAAVDTLRENGTLDALAEEWLASAAEAPVLE
ncbi:ABC transporter substrate-binding protein [Agromyces atrinae]|uniref:Amino acid ABC transporter substrate-binding protein n=1 Tax=Agromyces atrinae TaxID=592376 RepID=A0A4Q2MB12_9MICO|nr:ABC transporter substrate-binding protein [Agromyces atrinae]NYD66613.1 polar amino acid transport system substrate-binding protein [Agromyces atrinae]RXZ87281.1 amino acid ABC transporter substrate-binding protein [Agromyces atrinae]